MAANQQFFTLMQQAQTIESQGRIPEAIQLYRQATRIIPGHAAPDTKISTLTARQLWGRQAQTEVFAARDAPCITMSTLGQNGRFGNQIFQYAYLRLYAQTLGLEVETGDWIGRDLFGLEERLVTRPLPSLQEGSFDAAAALVPGSAAKTNVDLVGYFQLPTAAFRPHKSQFRRLFALHGRARALVDQVWQTTCGGDRPLIALHLRRTDFGYGRFWIAPSHWYLRWLDAVWGQWTNPLLYIATDDISSLAPFQRFGPLHAGPIEQFPADLKFVLDFSILARADALAIANSSFSFAAAMLNERAGLFVRPHPTSKCLQVFDPWDSQPLLDPPWQEPVLTGARDGPFDRNNQHVQEPAAQSKVSSRTRRNQACPCGSGKRYKHCHGRQP
jgi:hypothetical protein